MPRARVWLGFSCVLVPTPSTADFAAVRGMPSDSFIPGSLCDVPLRRSIKPVRETPAETAACEVPLAPARCGQQPQDRACVLRDAVACLAFTRGKKGKGGKGQTQRFQLIDACRHSAESRASL